jgi:hypothetical protein
MARCAEVGGPNSLRIRRAGVGSGAGAAARNARAYHLQTTPVDERPHGPNRRSPLEKGAPPVSPEVSVDAVMDELRERVRERLRSDLLKPGASPDFQDRTLFADVERMLREGIELSEGPGLILPVLLGDPKTWRLDTALRHQSHRGATAAAVVMWAKRRLLVPLVRWLFEYSRDNFERQRRVNLVLFACVQELALETARLRRAEESRSA